MSKQKLPLFPLSSLYDISECRKSPIDSKYPFLIQALSLTKIYKRLGKTCIPSPGACHANIQSGKWEKGGCARRPSMKRLTTGIDLSQGRLILEKYIRKLRIWKLIKPLHAAYPLKGSWEPQGTHISDLMMLSMPRSVLTMGVGGLSPGFTSSHHMDPSPRLVLLKESWRVLPPGLGRVGRLWSLVCFLALLRTNDIKQFVFAP